MSWCVTKYQLQILFSQPKLSQNLKTKSINWFRGQNIIYQIWLEIYNCRERIIHKCWPGVSDILQYLVLLLFAVGPGQEVVDGLGGWLVVGDVHSRFWQIQYTFKRCLHASKLTLLFKTYIIVILPMFFTRKTYQINIKILVTGLKNKLK